jgi:hypothetical protein
VEPQIGKSAFGWIEVADSRYDHDIVIGLSGAVRKRRKKLSKQVYGTSHTVSLAEARDVFEEGCNTLLIAAGKFGRVTLSDEARGFFDDRQIVVELLPTRQAVERWNALSGAVIGLFHVTC